MHSLSLTLVCAWALLFLAPGACWSAQVKYAGGTLAGLTHGTEGSLETADSAVLAVRLGRARAEAVSYDRENLIEYGQNPSRRLVMAA